MRMSLLDPHQGVEFEMMTFVPVTWQANSLPEVLIASC